MTPDRKFVEIVVRMDHTTSGLRVYMESGKQICFSLLFSLNRLVQAYTMPIF